MWKSGRPERLKPDRIAEVEVVVSETALKMFRQLFVMGWKPAALCPTVSMS